jgi:predicted ATP-dependent Lon-type protease
LRYRKIEMTITVKDVLELLLPGELLAKFQTSIYSDRVKAVFKAVRVE